MKYLLISFLCLIACTSNKENDGDQTFIKEDFCSSLHGNDTISLRESLAPFDTLLKNKTGVYVLEDGGSALISRAWLCEHAEKSIDVQYFIFSPDNIGLIAADYLVRAADRGVKVRILIDDILVEATIEDLLTLDSHANIEIKIYNPGVNLGKNICQKVVKYATDFRNANQRMHNKTLTVDGITCITGGRNMADEYFDYNHEYNFRDRDVLLIGKEVEGVQKSFQDFWTSRLSVPVSQVCGANTNIKSAESFEKLHQYACNPDNFWPEIRNRIRNLPSSFREIRNKFVWVDSVRFISDMPGKNLGNNGLHGGGITTDTLIQLIRQARNSVFIQSPYLVTTELSRKAFREATSRGVDIKILTNSLASTDNLEAFSGYQRDRKKILETGVKIFEFRPDSKNRYKIMTGDLQKKLNFSPIFGLHAKSMVIDGQVSVIGTYNLDPRSANLNTECITVIHSSHVATMIQNQMKEDLLPENAWETTLKFNPDQGVGFKKRLGTSMRKVIPKDIL